MNRLALGKTLFQVIIVCILSVGIVHANGGKLLDCCGHCEILGSHHGPSHQEHDIHQNCSSNFIASPCHLVSKFIPVADGYDFSGECGEESLTATNFATAGTGVLFLSYSNQYLAYLIDPQMKAPSVPLYYRNLSLLF